MEEQKLFWAWQRLEMHEKLISSTGEMIFSILEQMREQTDKKGWGLTMSKDRNDYM